MPSCRPPPEVRGQPITPRCASALPREPFLLAAVLVRRPRPAVVVRDQRLVLVVDAAQFGDRLDMLIHAQIDVSIDLAIVRMQSRRMLAAVLAAGVAAGLEGAQQALLEGLAFRRV